MRRIICVVAIFMLPVAVAAQQPPLSQTAIQIDDIINSWALTIEALQAQNAQLRARIKELEDKYEPKDKK